MDEPNDLRLADRAEWRFELAYWDREHPDKPSHVLAGIWEHPPGYLYWTVHEISQPPSHVMELALKVPAQKLKTSDAPRIC